jgi:hypothetical protein
LEFASSTRQANAVHEIQVLNLNRVCSKLSWVVWAGFMLMAKPKWIKIKVTRADHTIQGIIMFAISILEGSFNHDIPLSRLEFDPVENDLDLVLDHPFALLLSIRRTACHSTGPASSASAIMPML